MFYLLDWLRKKISEWVNECYPFSKNSSSDEDSKIISRPFPHHLNPNNKFSQNTKLISKDSNTLSKDLNIIYRMLDFKTLGLYNIFFSRQRKTEKNNSYNLVNQFYSYGR